MGSVDNDSAVNSNIKMALSSSQTVILSRIMLGTFIFLVTFWYFVSPYGVRSHPKFKQDLENFISSTPLHDKCEGEKVLENYTKWKVKLVGAETVIVHSHENIALDNMTLPFKAKLEWREGYETDIFLNDGVLDYNDESPW